MFTKAFWLMDTHGMPLPLQIAYAKERGLQISLPHFFDAARAAGWTIERALLRIEEALVAAHHSRLRKIIS